MTARLFLVVALSTSQPGFAQDYLSFKMVSSAQSPFGVYLDARRTNPAGLAWDAMSHAVSRSWATWNGVSCAYPKVSLLGSTTGVVPNAADTLDAFSVTPVWMESGDLDVAEIFGNPPYVTALAIPRAYAGVLETCDIFLNAASYAWSAETSTASNAFDLETVLLHEAGHCLGLGHFGDSTAVMHGSVVAGEQRRDLSPLDVATLCARYPQLGAVGSPCLDDGGCLAASDKCLAQPGAPSVFLCARGCTFGSTPGCELPLSCQSSTEFPPYDGACLLPGASVSHVGRACQSDDECGGSMGACSQPQLAASGVTRWVDGYCTQSCAAGSACPNGSSCVSVSPGPRCLQNCRVGLADCRPSYVCSPLGNESFAGVCIPQCGGDEDCADVAQGSCRTCDGLCVQRQNLGGHIGDSCEGNESCGTGQVCHATSAASSLKQCTQQCSLGCGLCPEGAVCTLSDDGALWCLRPCGTCPAGLSCRLVGGLSVCQPACQRDAECPVGQRCVQGDCETPQVDGGSAPALDAGVDVVHKPPPCGCSSAPAGVGLALWGRRRRRRADSSVASGCPGV